ncbi:Uncharacterised protein r2_g1090 [Pycnogonum litorale]
MLEDEQCGFRPGRSTTDQPFSLYDGSSRRLGSITKRSHACFVDLEKAYDRVPRHLHWSVVQKYEIEGQLLTAVKSLYESPNVCINRE